LTLIKFNLLALEKIEKLITSTKVAFTLEVPNKPVLSLKIHTQIQLVLCAQLILSLCVFQFNKDDSVIITIPNSTSKVSCEQLFQCSIIRAELRVLLPYAATVFTVLL
jgi:hypothetical protein